MFNKIRRYRKRLKALTDGQLILEYEMCAKRCAFGIRPFPSNKEIDVLTMELLSRPSLNGQGQPTQKQINVTDGDSNIIDFNTAKARILNNRQHKSQSRSL